MASLTAEHRTWKNGVCVCVHVHMSVHIHENVHVWVSVWNQRRQPWVSSPTMLITVYLLETGSFSVVSLSLGSRPGQPALGLDPPASASQLWDYKQVLPNVCRFQGEIPLSHLIGRHFTLPGLFLQSKRRN